MSPMLRAFTVTYFKNDDLKQGQAVGPTWYLVRERARALYGHNLVEVSSEVHTTGTLNTKILFKVE